VSEKVDKYTVWSANTHRQKPLWLMGTYNTRMEAIDAAATIVEDAGGEDVKFSRVVYSTDDITEQEGILAQAENECVGAIIGGMVIVNHD
jgi:hypothetical protein